MERARFSFRRKSSWRNKEKSKDKQKDDTDTPCISYISQQEANSLFEELRSKYCFSIDQLLEISGYSCAVAIARFYPIEVLQKDNAAILVCCGPGCNGGDGLVCARHLKLFGYKPSIFYPRVNQQTTFRNLRRQCEQLDIPFLSFFPSDPRLISDSYNLVVDAIFGYNFRGPPSSEFSVILGKLQQIQNHVPICSLDVPSGWEVNGEITDGLQPEMLVSITAPKLCANAFRGKYHALGGRFLTHHKLDLNLPPGAYTEPFVEIKSSGQFIDD